MATTNKTYAVKSDAAVLADLQAYTLSVSVTAYSSLTGKVVTFNNPPSADDVRIVKRYFDEAGDFDLV